METDSSFLTTERSAQGVRADVLDAWFDPSPNVLRKPREFLPFLLRSSPPVHAGQRKNLLVLMSMSKVYALSGLRVGYVVGSPELMT